MNGAFGFKNCILSNHMWKAATPANKTQPTKPTANGGDAAFSRSCFTQLFSRRSPPQKSWGQTMKVAPTPLFSCCCVFATQAIFTIKFLVRLIGQSSTFVVCPGNTRMLRSGFGLCTRCVRDSIAARASGAATRGQLVGRSAFAGPHDLSSGRRYSSHGAVNVLPKQQQQKKKPWTRRFRNVFIGILASWVGAEAAFYAYFQSQRRAVLEVGPVH